MSDVLPPGWYEDPWHNPGMRWWDGHQWTTHTVVPEGAPAPPPTPAPPRPVPRLRHPPWWVWTLAVLALLAPFFAFVALVIGSANRSNNYAYSPPAPTPTTPPVQPGPTTSYQPPHSLHTGPAPQGRSLRIQTRNGVIRVTVIGVVDPVDRGGYYRGPRSGTRWVGVRLRVVNAGSDDYIDDVGNDTRLVAGKKALQADSALLSTCAAFPVEVTLAPGEGREGCVIFEVPSGDQPSQLRFASDSYFGPELGTFSLGR